MSGRYHINHTTVIAKLADQAHEESNVIYYKRLETERADKVIFYDIFNQRFAELIVLECAGICDDYAMPDGTSQTAMILSMAIKNKFGVKI